VTNDFDVVKQRSEERRKQYDQVLQSLENALREELANALSDPQYKENLSEIATQASRLEALAKSGAQNDAEINSATASLKAEVEAFNQRWSKAGTTVAALLKTTIATACPAAGAVLGWN
jgi:vacuolar-type H+-ATPase subunit E/Vma4